MAREASVVPALRSILERMRALAGLLVVAALALASVASARGEGGCAAKVRMLDPAPLTLKGVGFAAHERVHLNASIGKRTLVRKLVARRNGTFLVVFPAVSYDRCSGELAVRAIGSRGSRVAWELVPLDCPETGASAPAG